MRYRMDWLLMVVMCIVAITVVPEGVAAGVPKDTADDDTKKLEELKKMFQSPYGEEDYYRNDRLLVTATGSQLPVHKAPAVASIITAKDIEEMGATTLDDVLETVPGIHVGPSQDSGYRTNYHIRGIYTGLNQQVLLMINGVPVNTLYGGWRQATFRMSTVNISRVEIIRGPGSAVHGADAFAGVINIITKDAHELKNVHGGFRAGSFDTYEAWLQGGGIWMGWEVAASLDYATSQGDKDRIITADQQTAFDKLFGTHASLAPGVMNTRYKNMEANLALRKGHLNFRQRYWANLDKSGPYWAGVTNTLSTGNGLDMVSYLADLRYDNPKLSPNWELNAGLNYLYQKSEFKLVLFPPGAVVLVGSDGNLFTGSNVVSFPDGVIGAPERTEQTLGGDVSTIYTGIPDHRLRLGTGGKYMQLEARSYSNFGPGVIDGTEGVVYGDLTDTTGTSYSYIPNKSRKLWFVFAQDEWSLARHWDLTAGVRYDHYSDFGGTINPRLALVWETRYDLTTKLLYGRAFRPPAFQELYVQNNPASQGNPKLEPETIQTVELAFDYQPVSSFRSIFNAFIYRAEDLIALVPDAPNSSHKTFQNSRTQKGYGFELEISWEITDTLRLRANGAFQDSRDEDTDAQVAYTPQLQVYLNPHWRFLPRWSLDAQLKWIGGRKRSPGDSRSEIKDDTLVGLTLRRKDILKHWDMAVAVRNLFNEDVREPTTPAIPDDYPMAGRSFYAEVQCHY
jgi:outer membrane receptor protein involved in Fe transport